jgi:hypothetical protein
MTIIATGKTVWRNAFSEIGDVDKRDVPAVVSEMNRTMERAIEELVTPVSARWDRHCWQPTPPPPSRPGVP